MSNVARRKNQLMEEQEKMEVFTEYIESLEDIIKEFADKMITWEDGFPSFSWKDSLSYYQEVMAREPSKDNLSTQAALVVASIRLIVMLKILYNSGADEVIQLEAQLQGKDLSDKKIAKIIEERLKMMEPEEERP